MKIIVLGAGGMAGHAAAIRLAEKGHDVVGLARRELPFCETIVSDARNESALRGIIENGRFGAVVNCVGVLNKFVDENPYDGIWLNSCLPHLLAALTENTGAKIVHVSTDCVFSGKDRRSYEENSFRSADSLYGRSKALGELDDGKNLTVRTSIVGPDINEGGIGLFNWFMKQRGSVGGYAGAIWGGVTTITLADAIHAALEQGTTGLIHLTNGEKISKFELLKLFNELRSEPVTIIRSGAVNEDKSLICTRGDFNFTVPSYEEMAREMGRWIRARKELYPLY